MQRSTQVASAYCIDAGVLGHSASVHSPCRCPRATFRFSSPSSIYFSTRDPRFVFLFEYHHPANYSVPSSLRDVSAAAVARDSARDRVSPSRMPTKPCIRTYTGSRVVSQRGPAWDGELKLTDRGKDHESNAVSGHGLFRSDLGRIEPVKRVPACNKLSNGRPAEIQSREGHQTKQM